MPLYLCLGQPTANPDDDGHYFMDPSGESSQGRSFLAAGHEGSHETNDIITIYEICEFGSSSDGSSTCTEQWEEENLADPWDQQKLELERSVGAADGTYLTQLYWAQRRAQRRYRAAAGKFAPRRHVHRKRIAKKFTRRGPSGPGGPGGSRIRGPRKGFFIQEHFVSLEHVPDESLDAYFAGRGRQGGGGRGSFKKKKPPKDSKCFRCGKPGHWSKECKDVARCFGCGQPGHQQATCPNKGRGPAMVSWGTGGMAAVEPPRPGYFQVMAPPRLSRPWVWTLQLLRRPSEELS